MQQVWKERGGIEMSIYKCFPYTRCSLSFALYLLTNSLLAVSSCNEYPFVGSIGRRTFATFNVPSVAHHEFKVDVVVNGGTQILIVFFKLFNSYNTIFDVACQKKREKKEENVSTVKYLNWKKRNFLLTGIELIQQFAQNFFWICRAFFDIRMPRRVVGALQIFNRHHAVTGLVQYVKGLVHKV